MSGISGLGQNASELGQSYMQLLVAQLQNQNPLEPMKNHEMTNQLAQIAQLERLESLDGTFRQSLFNAQVQQATDLIGKTVEFVPPEDGVVTSGMVDGVVVEDGQAQLQVGLHRVGLDEILSIMP